MAEALVSDTAVVSNLIRLQGRELQKKNAHFKFLWVTHTKSRLTKKVKGTGMLKFQNQIYLTLKIMSKLW